MVRIFCSLTQSGLAIRAVSPALADVDQNRLPGSAGVSDLQGAFNGILRKWPSVRDHASAFASAEPASKKGLPALAIRRQLF